MSQRTLRKCFPWKNGPIPQSVAELQSFLDSWDFTDASSRILQIYEGIVWAHTDTRFQEEGQQETTRTLFQWNQEHQQAFEKLIKFAITAPVLSFFSYKIQFELYTDPRGEDLGAVLYQTTNGHKRVSAYAIRCLSKAEKNYPAHKLEFLALKRAICEKFHDYLYRSFLLPTLTTTLLPMPYCQLNWMQLGIDGCPNWQTTISVSSIEVTGRIRMQMPCLGSGSQRICHHPWRHLLCRAHWKPQTWTYLLLKRSSAMPMWSLLMCLLT